MSPTLREGLLLDGVDDGVEVDEVPVTLTLPPLPDDFSALSNCPSSVSNIREDTSS